MGAIDGRAAATRAHVYLKGGQSPVAVPSCRDVLRLARLAKDGLIAAAPGRPPAVLDAVLRPTASEAVEGALQVPEAGTYETWLGGSFRSRLEVHADGKLAGDERHKLNQSPNQFQSLGEVSLTSGRHRVKIDYVGPDLHPGSDGNEVIPEQWPPGPFALGPLVFRRDTTAEPVSLVEPAKARTLCGKPLDWIEVIAR